MIRFLLLLACASLLACGDGDRADERVCIVNDSFNEQDEAPEIEQQAEEAGLEFAPSEVEGDSIISVCGTVVTVDAIIQTDEFPELSRFLATGDRRVLNDSEELLD
jgi:hypothetical protein